MKRGRLNLLIVLACLVVVVVVVVSVWPGEHEPKYQGRKLSYWLEFGYFSQQGSPERTEASHAIQEIGTNALPYLLTAIQYQHSSSRERAIKAVDRVSVVVPQFLRSRLHSLAVGQGERRGETAEFGFSALGAAADPAAPRLAALLYHSDQEICERAMDALAEIGIAGFPPLAKVLTNYSYPMRGTAAYSLSVLCRNTTNLGPAAISLLVQCLKDQDDMVVCNAAKGLGWLGSESATCVPALAELGWSTNPSVRFAAASALLRIGAEARPALRSLTEMLKDPELGVRNVATNALMKIAPEVLTNGIVK